MADKEDSRRDAPQDCAASSFEAHYGAYSHLVLSVIMRKFHVPIDDAEQLVQEVFLAYLTQWAQVRDVRKWLVAVACNTSRGYWRSRLRFEAHVQASQPVRTDPLQTTDALDRLLLVKDMLRSLPEASRRVLHHHYFEGYSARELAGLLGTSTRYAEKLIHVALRRGRDLSAAHR